MGEETASGPRGHSGLLPTPALLAEHCTPPALSLLCLRVSVFLLMSFEGYLGFLHSKAMLLSSGTRGNSSWEMDLPTQSCSVALLLS